MDCSYIILALTDNDLQFPCPKDQAVLSLLQIDSTEFSNLVGTSNDDNELTQRLKERNPTAYSNAQSSNARFKTLTTHFLTTVSIQSDAGANVVVKL